MSMTAVAYNCPNCGAELYFNADKQRMCCEFCLSEFTDDELNGNGARERAEKAAHDSEEYCEHMKEYVCPNCGAEFASDENTAAGICAYCHSPVMLKGRLSGQMKPDKIIPFKYGKEEAQKKFFEFIRKRWFLPKAFKSKENADNITGIYFPFWVTDADADARYDAEGTRIRVWRTGNTEYTETSRFLIEREGSIHFEDIVSSAISEGDKEMLEGILPYPSSSLENFSMPYLSGFTAKKRDIAREQLTDEVRGRMNGYSETLLRNTAGGYNTLSKKALRLNIKNSHWDYTLMPIWMLKYNTPKKTYTYAMNGYTGKIYGELPLSVRKLIYVCSGIFAGVAAAVALIGGFLL